jgi:hypothetical protein
MPSRNALVSIGVGLAVLICCGALFVVGAAGIVYYTTSAGQATPTPGPTRDPNATAAPAPTPNATQLAAMDAIQADVIRMRGLPPKEAVERKFLSEAEVHQRTLDDFNSDTTPEEWDDDERMLAAIGLLPPGFDLYDLLLRLYSEGVAGFYDPDTGELVIVSEAGGLNAYEKVTFAHEYNHALQDQNYDMRAMGFSDEGWDTDSERAAAVQALLEGDSSLLEEQYQATLSREEQREYDDVLQSFDVAIYSELPAYLLYDFFFPYSQGLDFVRRFYDEGGWARVDEVWLNPPVSTEHILHPEKYEAGELPVLVARPALTETLGAGWREIDSGVMGEWYTYLILAYADDEGARLSASTARRAAEGWGGDGYVVFYNEASAQTFLALQWDWDDQAEAEQFASAFETYAERRFGDAQTSAGHVCWEGQALSCLYINGVHTLWVIAPDRATVEAVLPHYPDF